LQSRRQSAPRHLNHPWRPFARWPILPGRQRKEGLMNIDLTGKQAVVSGSTGGIGRAIA
jgi:hypothetical protein